MAFVLTLLASTVASSPEISATGGTLNARPGRDADFRITRQSEQDVGAALDRITNELIPAAVMQAQREAFNATLTATSTLNGQMLAMQNAINTIQATVDVQMSSMNAQVSTQLSSIQSGVEASQEELAATIATTLSSADSTMEARLEAADAAAENRSAAVDVALTQAIDTMNSTMISGLASKADSAVHMWTGGCTSHGGSGWREYCLNQAHFNSAAPYFRASGSRFAHMKNGYYVMVIWAITRANSWQHTRCYMGGRRMGDGHMRASYHEGGYNWRDAHQTNMFPVRVGQQSWAQLYASGWNAWHSTNTNGDHSRITYYYYGVYNP